MVKKLHLVLITFSATLLSNAQTLLWQENFETDGNGISYTASDEFRDSTNDYFTRTDGNINVGSFPTPDCADYSGQLNSFYWATEDTDDGSRIDYKSIIFNQINTANFENLTFKGLFAAGSNCNTSFAYDFNDGAVISYSTDGGITYNQALKFRYDNANGDISNERIGLINTIDQSCIISTSDGGFNSCDATETPIGGTNINTYLSSSFQEFSFIIPGTPTTIDLKIELAFDAEGEEFAFDNFRLEGTDTPVLNIADVEGSEKTLTIYPNPTSNKLFLNNIPKSIIIIYNTNGQEISKIKNNNSSTFINVSNLSNGMYFLAVGKELIKFIKQ